MLSTKSKPKAKISSSNSNSIIPNASSSESTATTVVAKGTTIEGQFSSSQNVRLDGTINGDFNCKHRLVMGETGHLEGKIQTKDAIIKGSVNGEIIVSGTLHLMETAKIKGIIRASYMIVEEGAVYDGECKIGKIN